MLVSRHHQRPGSSSSCAAAAAGSITPGAAAAAAGSITPGAVGARGGDAAAASVPAPASAGAAGAHERSSSWWVITCCPELYLVSRERDLRRARAPHACVFGGLFGKQGLALACARQLTQSILYIVQS
jgi:hypothetical protein